MSYIEHITIILLQIARAVISYYYETYRYLYLVIRRSLLLVLIAETKYSLLYLCIVYPYEIPDKIERS